MPPEQRENLIVAHMPKVRDIAKLVWMRARGRVDFDELVSVGYVGLILAVDTFEQERGIQLKTYAQYRIRGAMFDYLRSLDWVKRTERDRIKAGLADEPQFCPIETADATARHDPAFIAIEASVDAGKLLRVLTPIQRSAVLAHFAEFTPDEIAAKHGRNPQWPAVVRREALAKMRAASL